MNHWERAASVAGPMSTPRVLSLRDGLLWQEPVDQQGTVRELRVDDTRVLVGPRTVEVFAAGKTISHLTPE